MIAARLKRWSNKFSAAVVALRYAVRAGGGSLLVLHLQETGLREQVEPVVAWLLEHDDCRVAIVVREVQREAYLRQSTLPLASHPRLFLVSEEFYAAGLYRPKVILSLHPESPSVIAAYYPAGAGAPFRVVMQHGLPDKETFLVEDGRGDTLSCYDGIFLYGPSSREGTLRLYAERYPVEFARLRIFDIGYPKTDALFQHGFDRAGFLACQGLDPGLPTVCYAPTYQRTASLQQQGVEVIEALASTGVNVLVKLHHVSLKGTGDGVEPWVLEETGGKDWRAILDGLERKHPNVRLARVHDANPCLLASDLLVTDVSGVAFEFLLLDRPIVFIDVPLLFEQFGVTGIHHWGRSCGDIVADASGLLRAVRENLDDRARGAESRKELLKRLIYNPGRGSESAGMVLRQLMEERS